MATHVTTATIEITNVKTRPAVATNRATELRLQKQRNAFATKSTTITKTTHQNGSTQKVAINEQNSTYVTWKVQKTTPGNTTLPRPQQNKSVHRVNTFTGRNVNENIRNKMEQFERKENGIEIVTATKKKTDENIIKVNGVKSSPKTNGPPTKLTNNNNSEEIIVIKKANTDNLKKGPDGKDTEITSQVIPKTQQVYQPVNVSRAPRVNISVRPWISSGQVSTDTDSQEALEILERRRKHIDQSIREQEEKSEKPEEKSESEDITVALRPISLDSLDPSVRDSSGVSLEVPYPKVLDLARHQMRPLWRDINGIKESGILEKLTKEQRIRQEAKFELMLSEGSYLHNLNMLKGHYMHNIHKHIPQVVSKEDYDTLFRNVLDVRTCSEEFLEALDEIWQQDPLLDGIYEVIIRHTTEKFSGYVQFCRNMLDMSNHLAALTAKNEAFANLLSVLINREGAQRLTLDAFLTSPMQRITKLPLLLKTILDKCEAGSEEQGRCAKAYEAASKIAVECDTVVTEKKRLEEILRLSQELEFSEECRSVPVVVAGRSVISRANVKHFAFRDKAPKREKLQLILLSDLLLVTKRKSDKLYIVVDYCHKDNIEMKEVENPTLYGETESIKQLKPLVLTLVKNSQDKKLDLVVTFKDQAQCKDWLQRFAVAEVTSEDVVQVVVLQEHEPENEEELSLSPGMVIQITGPEENGWCEGEVLSDGTKGRFMMAKTTKITSSKVKAANLRAKKDLRSTKEVDANRNSQDKLSLAGSRDSSDFDAASDAPAE